MTGFDSDLVRTKSGRVVPMPPAAEHDFTAALIWAQALFTQDPASRSLGREQWQAVAGRSAELDAVNKMLEAHGEAAIRGGTIGPTVLHGITADEIAASRRGTSPARPWWRFWG